MRDLISQRSIPLSAVLHSVTLWFVNWDKEARLAVERMEGIQQPPADDTAAASASHQEGAAAASVATGNEKRSGVDVEEGLDAGTEVERLVPLCRSEIKTTRESGEQEQRGGSSQTRGLEEGHQEEEAGGSPRGAQSDGLLTEVSVHPSANEEHEISPLLTCIYSNGDGTSHQTGSALGHYAQPGAPIQ